MFKIFQSIILCLRFPFLYPRNRFTNLHYNNWKILNICTDLYKQSYKVDSENNHFKVKCINRPKAFKRYFIMFFHNYILQLFHCIPTYTELDAMEPSWRNNFGIQLCKELKKELLKSGGLKMLYSYRIMQIKEKHDRLCWYDNWNTKGGYKIIEKYSELSSHISI